MNDIRIVRENGQIQALIGLWDPQQVRRFSALSFPGRILWGIYAGRLLNLAFKSPLPPRVGKLQSSLYIKHIACRMGKQKLLAAMMRNLANDIRRTQQYNYIWGAFFSSDPLFSVFDRMQITELTMRQHCAPLSSSWSKTPFDIESKPCYADFSMI